MNNYIKILGLFSLTSFLITPVFGQDFLSQEQAISLALKNNFGIQIGNNNVEIADNNQSILNSGFLPTLGVSAGASYNLSNVTANLQNGTTTELKGATSSAFNAGLNLNYTLFDGLGRWYNYKQLKEEYALSELEARTTMENAVLETLTAYYNVGIQTIVVNTLKESIQVSSQRLTRAENSYSYGQGNKLAVLNASVDLSNDSINLANAILNLANAKNNLNALLVQNIEEDFSVDTTVNFLGLSDKAGLKAKMLENNNTLLQAKQNLTIGNYNPQIARSGYLPTISATAQYGWNRGNNNQASFLASSVNYGLSTGATFSWNLFDGGSTKTAVQNAKISQENLMLNLQQTENNLIRDFENAWADYLNKLYLYKTQENNLESNRDNFSRTNEMFKLGQVGSVEFRQAQQNLLIVNNEVAQSKFSAKLAEYKILQLTGELLDQEF